MVDFNQFQSGMEVAVASGVWPEASDADIQLTGRFFPAEFTGPKKPDFNNLNLFFRFAPEITADLFGPLGNQVRIGGRAGVGNAMVSVNGRGGTTFDGLPYAGGEVALIDGTRVVVPGIILSYEHFFPLFSIFSRRKSLWCGRVCIK